MDIDLLVTNNCVKQQTITKHYHFLLISDINHTLIKKTFPTYFHGRPIWIIFRAHAFVFNYTHATYTVCCNSHELVNAFHF